MVFPKGFEPPSSEPESDILSIELRELGINFYAVGASSEPESDGATIAFYPLNYENLVLLCSRRDSNFYQQNINEASFLLKPLVYYSGHKVIKSFVR